ncbi:hypothetical protein FACS1894216_16410 [Synergistales bacterium]|nr:hypothetical protein FACS1894216_16410 [Synergistales bacterium]
MTLGKSIRTYRKKKLLTQAELAHQIDVHEVTLRSWERGAYQPKASDVQKLCGVLGCTETELLNGAPDEGEIRFSFVMNISEVGMMEIAMNEFKFGTGDKDMFGMFRIPKDTDPAEIGRLVEKHIRAEQAGDAVKRAKLMEMEG